MNGEKRQCWICFAEESVTFQSEGDWVRPCKCRGTTRWVHQACLLSWLGSREEGSLLAPSASCPQCHTTYRISEQRLLPLWALKVFDKAEGLMERTLLYASVGGVAAGSYLLSWAYGATALRAVLGRDELLYLLTPIEGTRMNVLTSLRIAVGIPLIPLYILSLRHPTLAWLHPFIPFLVYNGPSSLRLFQWPPSRSTIASHLPFVILFYEEMVGRRILPAIRRYLAPQDADGHLEEESLVSVWDSFETADEAFEDHTLKISVVGTTATLLLPFISSALGWMLFGRTRMDPFVRTLLGSAVVVSVRGALRTLTWYQRILSKSTRRVLDYKEPK